MNTLRSMWASLSPRGKVAMMALVALLLIAAMAFGYGLGWIPELLGVS